MEKVALSFSALLFFNILCCAQTNITLRSPNGRIVCNILASNDGIKYEIAYNKTVLINLSQLSLQFKNGASIDNVRPKKEVFKDTIERYNLITGRSSSVEDRYKQVTIPLVLSKSSQQI